MFQINSNKKHSIKQLYFLIYHPRNIKWLRGDVQEEWTLILITGVNTMILFTRMDTLILLTRMDTVILFTRMDTDSVYQNEHCDYVYQNEHCDFLCQNEQCTCNFVYQNGNSPDLPFYLPEWTLWLCLLYVIMCPCRRTNCYSQITMPVMNLDFSHGVVSQLLSARALFHSTKLQCQVKSLSFIPLHFTHIHNIYIELYYVQRKTGYTLYLVILRINSMYIWLLYWIHNVIFY